MYNLYLGLCSVLKLWNFFIWQSILKDLYWSWYLVQIATNLFWRYMKHTNKPSKTFATLHLQNIISDSGSQFYLETIKRLAWLKR